jgi:hypothetical protein
VLVRYKPVGFEEVRNINNRFVLHNWNTTNGVNSFENDDIIKVFNKGA